jgi:hypothetical protein
MKRCRLHGKPSYSIGLGANPTPAIVSLARGSIYETRCIALDVSSNRISSGSVQKREAAFCFWLEPTLASRVIVVSWVGLRTLSVHFNRDCSQICASRASAVGAGRRFRLSKICVHLFISTRPMRHIIGCIHCARPPCPFRLALQPAHRGAVAITRVHLVKCSLGSMSVRDQS